jgi:hypothetical protein
MRGIVDRRVRPRLGAKPVQKITVADVRAILGAVSHLSGSTRTKVYRALREGFAVAIREDALVPRRSTSSIRASYGRLGLESGRVAWTPQS